MPDIKQKADEMIDTYMVEEYGKWKIGRAEAKQLIDQIIDFTIVKARAERNKEIVEMIEKWHEENKYACVASGEGQECCYNDIINLITNQN